MRGGGRTRSETIAGAGSNATSRVTDRRLAHIPALDGLRGVAVAVVLLFHGGFSWMVGGYLGVSTFFTLSGFLITVLLLRERAATASIDLRSFWTRRFRRLLPAALAALALATLFGVTAADAVQRRHLAGDVTASLLDVANWHFIVSGQAYADLFGAPSPVLHFWSLAIEEQFYLVFPVIAWAALLAFRGSRAWFAALLVVLTACSIGRSLGAGLSPDRIYFGTDTRAAELLIGALLATIVANPRASRALAHDRRLRVAIVTIGPLALAACVVLWLTAAQESTWLYQGGFAAYAVLTAIVITASTVSYGPIRRLLTATPLRRLGTISYGLYLYHWPIFLWLTPARTGWSDAELLVPRLLLAFGLAIASYHLLEMPIRRGLPLFGIRPIRFVPAVAGALVLVTVGITVAEPEPPVDFDLAAAELETIAAVPPPAPTTTRPIAPVAWVAGSEPAPPVAGPPPRPRAAVFGDSTAMMTAIGLNRWASTAGEMDVVPGAAWLGCGVGRGGERRSGNEYGVVPENCNAWATTWADRIRASQPNIAVVQIGPWDVTDRRLAGDDTWRALGDPVYDTYLLEEMSQAVDTLSAEGAQVLWLSAPPVGAGTLGDGQAVRGVAADPARTARLNELIAELPSRRPGKVSVVDLAGWLDATGEDIRLRPDGVHFGADQAAEVAERYLGGALIEAFDRDWTTAETQRLADAARARRRVLVLGDPSAQTIAESLASWGLDSGRADVATIGQPPCGFLPSARRRGPHGVETTPDECASLQFGWLQSAVAARADIVLVVPSAWDLTSLSFDDQTDLHDASDSTIDDRLRTTITELTGALAQTTTRVVWLSAPPLPPAASGDDRRPPVTDAARLRYNTVLAEAATATPASAFVDLGAVIGQEPTLSIDDGTGGASFVVPADERAELGARLGPLVVGDG